MTMRIENLAYFGVLPTIALICLLGSAAVGQQQTRNVILITLDGVRTQEIFAGLDADVFRSANKDFEKSRAYQRFWAPTPKERREKLMPFFWQTLMTRQGSIAGNRELKSSVQTTNRLWFSYPGYSEILTGQAHDDVIRSNGFGQNPYPSVLDFLQQKLKLNANQVADFSSWDVFNRIATSRPGAFLINAGYEPYETSDPQAAALSRTQSLTLSPWPSVRHDYYTFKLAMAHIRSFHPRVVHIGLGETDDWSHDKNYERVLDALSLNDDYFKELWNFLQADPQYRGSTSIIITTDHGRGKTVSDWQDHGEDVPEAQNIWMAFISPEAAIRGEWQNAQPIYQNQAAATLSKFLGIDYSEQNPHAGKPVMKLFSESR